MNEKIAKMIEGIENGGQKDVVISDLVVMATGLPTPTNQEGRYRQALRVEGGHSGALFVGLNGQFLEPFKPVRVNAYGTVEVSKPNGSPRLVTQFRLRSTETQVAGKAEVGPEVFEEVITTDARTFGSAPKVSSAPAATQE